MSLVLYGHTFSSYTWKVLIALYENGAAFEFRNLGPDTPQEHMADWLGRWRMAHNEGNDWGMDRAAQRSNEIYSGIDGIHLQDQAITESMGGVVDHELEHLAPSDQMITRTRRRLLMAASPSTAPAATRNSGRRIPA